ncbi:unnamed protein product [Moneuplotes crassus]|uniref:Uncharacterized protein n=1 Tax=Euplotes crassus TaxID=5936 RepID=A0AAD1XIG0_EUPCR|nr:unnamed protein product [Moneuplotes crassus]
MDPFQTDHRTVLALTAFSLATLLAMLGVWPVLGIIGVIRILSNLCYAIGLLREFLCRTKQNLAEKYGKGTYALITGAAHGIGLEYARQIAKEGFNLALLDLDKVGLDIAHEIIRKETPDVRIVAVGCDLATLRSVDQFEKALQQVLDLDISILVNNVGISTSLPFEEGSPKTVSTMVHLNMTSVAVFTSLIYKKILNRVNFSSEEPNKHPKSAIISMASCAGYIPLKIAVVYSMTKAFTRFFMDSLSSETEIIDFLTVSPGFVSTRMTNHRKDASTISTDYCVSNALKALGRFKETSIVPKITLTYGWISQSLWYINNDLYSKHLNYALNDSESQQMGMVLAQKERERDQNNVCK